MSKRIPKIPDPAPTPPESPLREIDAESRLADLRRLYDRLVRDIEANGAFIKYPNGIAGKNPAVPLLLATHDRIRRLQADLATRNPTQVDEALRRRHQDGLFLGRRCGDKSCKCMGRTG